MQNNNGKTAKIVIAGDLFPVPSNYSRFSQGDITDLFGDDILSIFKDADFRICNLEGALTDSPAVGEKTGPVIKAPKSAIKAYCNIGIDCCTLANNHITDGGNRGVIDTIDTLNNNNISFIGAGKNIHSIQAFHIFHINDFSVAIYNVAETMYNEATENDGGVHLYDEYIVCEEIRSLKQKCDFLFIIYHGGAEKYRYPSPQTRTRFHRMADSGADVVLSQHTHCIGCEEYYGNSYLLYGQGNFLFRSFNNEYTDTGLLIEILLNNGKFSILKYIVNAVGDTVRLDKSQDFSEFNIRSSEIYDTTLMNKKYAEYSKTQLPLFFDAYKGQFIFRKILSRFFKQSLNNFIIKTYSRHQLLFILHSLRSEQNRETAIIGLKAYLDETRRDNK